MMDDPRTTSQGSATSLPIARNWGAGGLDGLARAGLLYRDVPVAQAIAHGRGRLVYLATPYSRVTVYDDGEFDPMKSLDCAVRAARWSRALAVEGVTAISPIIQAVEMVHADFIEQDLDPLDQVFWTRWCRPLLDRADMIVVPPIPGWDESEGIWAEVRVALGQMKRVFLIAEGSA